MSRRIVRGRLVDITGVVFGRLTALSHAKYHVGKQKGAYWNCVCKCGANVVVHAVSLRRGNTKSCGCLKNDWRAEARVAQA